MIQTSVASPPGSLATPYLAPKEPGDEVKTSDASFWGLINLALVRMAPNSYEIIYL